MGTNYYLKSTDSMVNKDSKSKHIGKSSGGWCFSLHVYPEQGIVDLPDWEQQWLKPGTTIVDEYGSDISPHEMRQIITERSWAGGKSFDTRFVPDEFYSSLEAFHACNHSEEGPAGLIRFKVDNERVISHGNGTWDCIVNDFS